MLNDFLRAFFLIFIAEMGDKSQIIAMTFATRYKLKDVLFGVTIGIVLNHALAIILGNFISIVIPMSYIQIIAGFLFIIFGLKTLSIDEAEVVEEKKEFSPILTVAVAFFVGEFGDKTQLATMAIAAESVNPIFVLIGSSTAMIATSLLGIFIGSKIGKKIPEVSIKIVSSLVFLIFGTVRLLTTIDSTYLNPLSISIFLTILTGIELFLIYRIQRSDHRPKKVASQALYEETKLLKKTLDSICLTEEQCGTCNGVGCLLGYVRHILDKSRASGEYYESMYVNTDKLIKKNYDKKKVLDALIMILEEYNKNNWIDDEDFVVNKIKSSLEIMLFNTKIETHDKARYINIAKSYDKGIGRLIEKNI